MNNWTQFLFGTPRRTLTSIGVFGFLLLVLVGLIAPTLMHALAERLHEAFAPLIQAVFNAVLTLGLVLAVAVIGWRALFKKGGSKKG